MNLHEFQAKQLFRAAGIPVPKGEVVDTPSGAVEAARRLGGQQWMVKAQIHAGARMEAGGIRRFNDLEELQRFAQEMLGERLITTENSPSGQPVNQLLIELSCGVKNCYHLSVMLDPHSGQVVFQGGLSECRDSSELGDQSPGELFQVEVDPVVGLQHFQSRQLAVELRLNRTIWLPFFEITQALYRLFVAKDLLLIEIGSLVENDRGQMMVLDVRVQVDDNALVRQPELAQWADRRQDENQVLGDGLGFIAMEGDIGCIVNGSGLALATLDIIQLNGGSVANIVEVDNGADADALANACRLVWDNGRCSHILVNIVGGIVRCDKVAAGIIDGIQKYNIECPIVVRMEGTRAEEAKALFMQSNEKVEIVKTLDDAVISLIGTPAS